MAFLRVSTDLDIGGQPLIAAEDLEVGELVAAKGHSPEVPKLRLVTEDGIFSFYGEWVADPEDTDPYYRRIPKGTKIILEVV